MTSRVSYDPQRLSKILHTDESRVLLSGIIVCNSLESVKYPKWAVKSTSRSRGKPPLITPTVSYQT
jgi:hypothetical protein